MDSLENLRRQAEGIARNTGRTITSPIYPTSENSAGAVQQLADVVARLIALIDGPSTEKEL